MVRTEPHWHVTAWSVVHGPGASASPRSRLLLLLLLLLSRVSHVRLCAAPQTAAHQAWWG